MVILKMLCALFDQQQFPLKERPECPMIEHEGVISVKIDPMTGKHARINDPIAKFEYFMAPYIPDEDQSMSAQDNTTTPEGDTSETGVY
jgi:hypothetical protein